MHLTTLLLTSLSAALTAALTATAAPLSSPLEARACQTVYPGINFFRVIKDPGQNVDVPQDLSFTVPSGAVGPCSLAYSFPADFEIYGTKPQLNVVDLNGPNPGSVIGTTTLEAGKTVTITSSACRPIMKFRLVIAGDEAGEVTFLPPSRPGGQNAGLYVTHSC